MERWALHPLPKLLYLIAQKLQNCFQPNNFQSFQFLIYHIIYWFLPVLLYLEMHNTNVSIEVSSLSKLFVTTITSKVSPLLQGFVTKNVSFILLPGPEMNIKQK